MHAKSVASALPIVVSMCDSTCKKKEHLIDVIYMARVMQIKIRIPPTFLKYRSMCIYLLPYKSCLNGNF